MNIDYNRVTWYFSPFFQQNNIGLSTWFKIFHVILESIIYDRHISIGGQANGHLELRFFGGNYRNAVKICDLMKHVFPLMVYSFGDFGAYNFFRMMFSNVIPNVSIAYKNVAKTVWAQLKVCKKEALNITIDNFEFFSVKNAFVTIKSLRTHQWNNWMHWVVVCLHIFVTAEINALAYA